MNTNERSNDLVKPGASGNRGGRFWNLLIRYIAAIGIGFIISTIVSAQEMPRHTRGERTQLPNDRRENQNFPVRPGRGELPNNKAAITLTLEPAAIYQGDRVTLRWRVKDPRPNVEWTLPVHLRCSFDLAAPFPDPVPKEGAYSFTAGSSPKSGTFTLSTGAALFRTEKSVDYRMEAEPSISRLTVEKSPSHFEQSQRGSWGDRIGIVGSNFGQSREGSQVRLTIYGRTFPMQIRTWEDDRIVVNLDNIIPIGTANIQVVKGGGRLSSNPISFSIVNKTHSSELPTSISFGPVWNNIIFGPPKIAKLKSSNSKHRDLSDHYGLAAEVTFRIVERQAGHGDDREARADFGDDSVKFTLLTYNIAQVPAPFYEGVRSRDENIDDIAEHLNRSGFEIVCIQEAFSNSTRERLLRATREVFPYHAQGPEGGVFEQESGLLILSRFPINESHKLEYSEGVSIPDNYAAKGILHVRIQIGARPADSIDLFTTHTQSGGNKDEKENRLKQFDEAMAFIQQHSRSGLWILTGDLNVNGSSQNQDEYNAMMNALSQPWDLWKEFNSLDVAAGYTYCEENDFGGGSSIEENERFDFILVHYPKTPPPPAVGIHNSDGRRSR